MRVLTNDANIIHESTSKDMTVNCKIQVLIQILLAVFLFTRQTKEYLYNAIITSKINK